MATAEAGVWGLPRRLVYIDATPLRALHDSRFVGRDKRQREMIGKRKRNWLARLAGYSEIQRQAILDAIEERFGEQ